MIPVTWLVEAVFVFNFLKRSESKDGEEAEQNTYVTFHHEMSRNVPDSHFHVFIFSESEFCAIN